jgi:hypothetical protein
MLSAWTTVAVVLALATGSPETATTVSKLSAKPVNTVRSAAPMHAVPLAKQAAWVMVDEYGNSRHVGR